MTIAKRLALVATFAVASCSGGSKDPAEITIADAWARATVPGQTSAAAYLTIANSGEGTDRLVSITAPVATGATLHSSSSAGGVMRMRLLADGLAIPAGTTVKLQPSGNHAMLTGLSAPLAKGSSFPLTLRFERSGDRRVMVHVLDPSTAGATMESL